jgi:hypothetical protein
LAEERSFHYQSINSIFSRTHDVPGGFFDPCGSRNREGALGEVLRNRAEPWFMGFEQVMAEERLFICQSITSIFKLTHHVPDDAHSVVNVRDHEEGLGEVLGHCTEP